MFGAILGDMIGSPYEFDRGNKTKEFPLFNMYSTFTDDSVMTIAVAEALLNLNETEEDDAVRQAVVRSLQRWGRIYPDAGYGSSFFRWLFDSFNNIGKTAPGVAHAELKKRSLIVALIPGLASFWTFSSTANKRPSTYGVKLLSWFNDTVVTSLILLFA